MELSKEEQDFESRAAAGKDGKPFFPVISQFEVLMTAIFPQSPGAAAATIHPHHLPSPFRHLAEAKDDGRGRTAGLVGGAGAAVPKPEVLQGLFTLITNSTDAPVSFFVILLVNTPDDAQAIASNTLALDLRSGAPTMGAWIAPAGQNFAYYQLNALLPQQTTNLACIPNFLKTPPIPDVSVRGLLCTDNGTGPLSITPEQRAVFYPTDGSGGFSTVAYCLTTRTGNNTYST